MDKQSNRPKAGAPAKKISVNRKLVSALTLLVAIALTVIFLVLGFTGKNMDSKGLYKLLPWLPTTGDTSLWRQALVPGAALGQTQLMAFAAQGEGQAEASQWDEAVKAMVKRLNDLGYTDVAVVAKDQLIQVTLPEGADQAKVQRLLSSKGEFAFADPSGQVFLTGDHIKAAGFGYADQSGSNIALSFELDAEGKKIFGEKSIELIGQSISVLRDGQVLTSPSISQPLMEGSISIPGFDVDQAQENAILMRSGPLPIALAYQSTSLDMPPLLGQQVQPTLVIGLYLVFALIAVYFIIKHRLGGIMAAWMLLLQLSLSHFFAALIGAGFTLLTLAGIYISFLVTVFAQINLFDSVNAELKKGRGLRQAFRDSYAGRGHVSLDVFALSILVSIIMIMMNQGSIKRFSEVFAIGLILGLVLVHVVQRFLLKETVHLTGTQTALFAGVPTKEA